MENKIRKGDKVKHIDFPNAQWKVAIVQKLNTDEDEVLIQTIVQGRLRSIWIDIDKLIRIE